MTDAVTDRDALAALLVEAIADQRLKAVAEQALAEGHLVGEALVLAEQAVSACRAISEQMLDVQEEARAVLSGGGVEALSLGALAERGDLQFHRAEVSVARADLGAALEALGGIGFAPSLEMTPARVAALARTADSLQLVRFDATTTRLVLRLDGAAPSRLPRGLRPRTADLALVSLPRPLAGFYGAVKPFRVAWERLTGRRSSHHEIDFLGTPEGLIAPILESLGLGTDDILFDLGCGDGRILRVAAERFGCRAIGVEHNGDLVARARAAADASPAGHLIEVRQGTAGAADLSGASVVFMFLPSALLRDLAPIVRGKVGADARLVMHEQSRPSGAFLEASAVPIVGEGGVTVVRVSGGGLRG